MKFREHFMFTRQERRGIFLFFLLASLYLVFMEIRERMQYSQDPPPLIEFNADSDQDTTGSEFTESLSGERTPRSAQKASRSTREQKNIRFDFDPNSISADSLRLLGFSDFASRNLVNYVAKGGRIYDKRKLLTVYGVDSMLVSALEPWIRYPGDPKNKVKTDVPSSDSHKKWHAKGIVDLNTADSLQLDSVPGIGPYTAAKILKMRRRLGGFVAVGQLRELSLVPDSTYERINKYVTASRDKISPININTADFKTFIRHPYFSKETTSAILNYRKQHGNFKNPAEIGKIMSVKEEVGAKILPYLKVSD
jgi:competence protein ComEA